MMTTASEQCLAEDQIEQYHQDGYLVVRGLFGPEETAVLRDHYMALHAAGPVEGSFNPVPLEQTGGDLLQHYPRIMMPHRYDEASLRAMLDPRFEVILRDLLAEEALAAQSMLYFKPPGARGQALHQDNFYLKVAPGTCLAAWMALDDTDPENGGLTVVPGSHRLDVLCPHPADLSKSFTMEELDVPEGMEVVPVDLRAGDVLFFNGSVIHGSGPNESKDRFRRSFICHYVPESTLELSEWYGLVDFDGEPVTRDAAQGGGPCGSEEAEAFEAVRSRHVQELEAGRLQGAVA